MITRQCQRLTRKVRAAGLPRKAFSCRTDGDGRVGFGEAVAILRDVDSPTDETLRALVAQGLRVQYLAFENTTTGRTFNVVSIREASDNFGGLCALRYRDGVLVNNEPKPLANYEEIEAFREHGAIPDRF